MNVSKILGTIDTVSSNYWRGLYSIDNLYLVESVLDLNSNNLVLINKSDQYYIVFFSTQNPNINTYVDTLAQKPQQVSTELKNFIDFYAVDHTELKLPVRTKNQSSALFAIYFAHNLCAGKNLEEISKNFSHINLRENYSLVKDWFERKFKRQSTV